MFGTCKNCKYHWIDSTAWGCFGICNNESSPSYRYITDNDESCMNWESDIVELN